MNIKQISFTDNGRERRDYSDMYAIEIDGKNEFHAMDGEPEDNSLGRNFNDIYKIIDLMKLAYEAGKNGEDFNVSSEEVDDYDF